MAHHEDHIKMAISKMGHRHLVYSCTALALVGAGSAAMSDALTESPHAIVISVGPVSPPAFKILAATEQSLISGCMASHGFRYWPVPSAAEYPYPQLTAVISSVSWANGNGFGENPAVSDESQANEGYVNNLPTNRQSAYANALVGTEAGPAVTVALPSGGILGHSSRGCQALADAKLYGDYRDWFQARSVVADLPVVWQLMILGDHQYQTTLAGWSGCMHAKGYQYSSPAQTAATFQRPPSVRPTHVEIRVAVAEARCADSTGLAKVTRDLTREFSAEVDHRYQYWRAADWRLERRALIRLKRFHLLTQHRKEE